VIPVERLSHRQRELTPPAFAAYLVARVREITGNAFVAALFIRKDSPYRSMTGVDPWGVERDATMYDGPLPIVAHPACGPWGKYAQWCMHQDYKHGIISMRLVQRFGGVVEQPQGSCLFQDFGRGEGWVEKINQGDYGHQSTKATLLYFHA